MTPVPPPPSVKNVVVLGASYAGCRAADLLAKTLPPTHRVVLIDRQSHFQHLYLFPRFGVVPNHAHKAFIPYTNLFTSPIHLPSTSSKASASLVDDASRAHHKSVFVHAGVTQINEGYVVLDRDLTGEESLGSSMDELADLLERTGMSDEEHGQVGTRCVPWDFLVVALGCTLPPPLVSPSRTKKEGVDNLARQQALIARSSSILIAGGGALGIQFATDIADLYNNHPSLTDSHLPPSRKKVTIVHSRDRFLPLYDTAMDAEIKRRMEELGIECIMGDRLKLPSEEELNAHELEGGMRKIMTEKGNEIEYDLLLRCTGQKPNSGLLSSFLPASVNADGYINVLPTTQVALPPSHDSRENIFAIGDIADAGVIKAGHTGWNQAGIAAENILHLLDHPYADRTAYGGGRDAVGTKRDSLLEYEKSVPQIKVTLGLSHAVSELVPSMDSKATEVKVSTEGPVDGHWSMIWSRFGADPSDPTV